MPLALSVHIVVAECSRGSILGTFRAELNQVELSPECDDPSCGVVTLGRGRLEPGSCHIGDSISCAYLTWM